MCRLKAYRIVLTVVVMVEAKASVDEEKRRKNLKGGKVKWSVIGAVLLLAIAMAITSKQAQNHKSCQCSQVCFVFLSFSFIFGNSHWCDRALASSF